MIDLKDINMFGIGLIFGITFTTLFFLYVIEKIIS